MPKLITYTGHDDDKFCIDNSKRKCIWLMMFPPHCGHFKTKDGYARMIRTENRRPKRCAQCISAELKAGDE